VQKKVKEEGKRAQLEHQHENPGEGGAEAQRDREAQKEKEAQMQREISELYQQCQVRMNTPCEPQLVCGLNLHGIYTYVYMYVCT